MDFVECTKTLLADLRAQAGFAVNERNLTKPQHPLILVEISDNTVNSTSGYLRLCSSHAVEAMLYSTWAAGIAY